MVCRYSEGSARYEDDNSYDNEKAETATSGDDTQSESVPERKRRRSKVQVSGYTTGEENSENESLSGKFISFTLFPKGSHQYIFWSRNSLYSVPGNPVDVKVDCQ